MSFKLTPELTDQIIFAMENQTKDFFLEPDTLLILSEDQKEEAKDPETLIELPEWNPSDGYQLMDSFTATLKNPVYRQRLRDILSSGRGVFRGFKNVLKERPDMEKLWFTHKDREMKRRVRLWYEELCEFWGVEALLGAVPEETDDLFMDEFTMEEIDGRDEMIAAFRERHDDEIYREFSCGMRELLLHPSPFADAEELSFRALSPEGVGCALVSLLLHGDCAVVDCLYVLPEYRGAGIASGLLDRAARACFERDVRHMMLSLPPEGELLLNNLGRRGFKRIGAWQVLDVPSWYYEQAGAQ